MSLKKHIINEFNERVFKENYARIYKCLSMLDERQLWTSPSKNIPSAGCLILHLCGNARQWILSGLTQQPDNRDRDQEFVVQRNIRKSDFIFLLENMKVQLKYALNQLEDRQFEQRYAIQGFDVTGFSAVMHVMEHFSYHTGQITTLTKWHGNRETGYYADIDLNKHNRWN